MTILTWLSANWVDILFIIAVIAALVILYLKGEKKIVYRILYALVTEAEARFGGGTGELKLASVLSELYARLPAVMRALVSEKRIIQWVEDVLAQAKDKWRENAQIEQYIGAVEDESAKKIVGFTGKA